MSETVSKELKTEERQLLTLLKTALRGNAGTLSEGEFMQEEWNWLQLETIAKKHAVWSLLYDTVTKLPSIPQEFQQDLERVSRQSVLQSYRLLFLTKYVINTLSAHQIPAVALKGVSAAASYPVPELRKSGDVDILVFCKKEKRREVDRLLRQAGLVPVEEQYVDYHVVYKNHDGIEIELHYELTKKLENRRFNEGAARNMKNSRRHRIRREIMGVSLPVFDHPYQAYELLLHMLKHFLSSGFGLKLLCDWVVLWNREEWTNEEKSLFWKLTGDCGICCFARQVTSVCVTYLGLDADKVSFMDLRQTEPRTLLEEIFSAEEFGNSSQERMVMLQSSGLAGYVREFHYQMHMNYPKAGRIFLLWPGLWMATLLRFIRNNRTVRHVSTLKVLKEAGRRGKFLEKIKIYD